MHTKFSHSVQVMFSYLLLNSAYFPGLASAFLGFLFPVFAVFFMLWHENLVVNWHDIKLLHQRHLDLCIIWSAPVMLAIFGNIIGKNAKLLKQKMDSLSYRTTQLNTILDTAASAIITIDKKGNILSFNQAAERIFGFQLSEIVGQNIKCLMPDAIAEQHDAFLQRYFDNPQATNVGKRREVQARRKTGELFPALLRINPMEIDGELFFSGLIDDISETKALQSQLGQAQKLEAIGQLASGVAHEINTPIQYIGDNLSALRDNFADMLAYQRAFYDCVDDTLKMKLDALAEQYDLVFIQADSPKAIEQSLEGIKRVAEIVKAMKTFSHVESNRAPQAMNLHEALSSALAISRNSYKYIADVETDFSADVGVIECFASELNQVFLNLIINAAHAIEEKQAGRGVIRVTTRQLNDGVEILIEDNGVGIPFAMQEQVFNLFFTTKPVGKGTGQGLSLAHTIVVEKHRGKLFFESEPGTGTVFHIQLPLAKQ